MESSTPSFIWHPTPIAFHIILFMDQREFRLDSTWCRPLCFVLYSERWNFILFYLKKQLRDSIFFMENKKIWSFSFVLCFYFKYKLRNNVALFIESFGTEQIPMTTFLLHMHVLIILRNGSDSSQDLKVDWSRLWLTSRGSDNIELSIAKDKYGLQLNNHRR